MRLFEVSSGTKHRVFMVGEDEHDAIERVQAMLGIRYLVFKAYPIDIDGYELAIRSINNDDTRCEQESEDIHFAELPAVSPIERFLDNKAKPIIGKAVAKPNQGASKRGR